MVICDGEKKLSREIYGTSPSGNLISHSACAVYIYDAGFPERNRGGAGLGKVFHVVHTRQVVKHQL